MNNGQWLKIDTAPRDGSYVPLYSPPKSDPSFGVYAAHGDDRWLCTNDEYPPYPEPTHWMPLPKPPNEVSDK